MEVCLVSLEPPIIARTRYNRAKVATQPPDVRRLTTWGTLKSACQLNTTLRLNTTLWLTIETLWLNTTLWCNAT